MDGALGRIAPGGLENSQISMHNVDYHVCTIIFLSSIRFVRQHH